MQCFISPKYSLNWRATRLYVKNKFMDVKFGEFQQRPLNFQELQQTGKFLGALKTKVEEVTPLTGSEIQELNELVKFHSKSMDSHQLASMISMLGSIKAFSNQWNTRPQTPILLHSISRISSSPVPSFTADDVSQILTGLARMKIDWEVIKKEDAFLRSISHLNSLKINEKHIGDIIWSLGVLGASWSSLPVELKELIMNVFERDAAKLTAYSLSSVLWAWAKMGITWRTLSPTVQQIILERIPAFAANLSPQQASKVLWAFGIMGIKVRDLGGVGTVEVLTRRVGDLKKSQMGNAISSSQAFVGLAKMGLQWNSAPRSFQLEILQQLQRICQSYNAKGITNAIFALGSMGAHASQIPPESEQIIMASACRVLPECNAWAMSNIIWGLAKMKYSWNRFPKVLRDSFMTNFVRLEEEMNEVDIGTLLWSFAELECSLDKTPQYFLDSVFTALVLNFETMKPQEVSRSVWGLSGTGISWNMLPDKIRWNINSALRRVGEDMSPQEVANCAYGLSIMSFDVENPADFAFRGAHETLLNVIRSSRRVIAYAAAAAGAGRAAAATAAVAVDASGPQNHDDRAHHGSNNRVTVQELEQLRIFAHYLKVTNFVTDSRRIPQELLDVTTRVREDFDANNADNYSARSSKLQERVVIALREAILSIQQGQHYSVDLEMSSFNGVFPVDAAIYKNGKIAALLEVDGPHHFVSDGRLRRKDLLKERMYRLQNPTALFHRVRWDEESKVGSEVVAQELASLVEAVVRKQDDVVSNTVAYMQKGLSDFFSWGLRNSVNNERNDPSAL